MLRRMMSSHGPVFFSLPDATSFLYEMGNVESEVQKAYSKGMPKSEIFNDGKTMADDSALNYVIEFSHMLGFDDVKMPGSMQLCVKIHATICNLETIYDLLYR
uniref:Uncharacterized protein n=1 Tax=Oryza meridionalis TaxID=40149 RepID=A0A0E0EI89_9ORYZ